jgi:hypothetical protein
MDLMDIGWEGASGPRRRPVKSSCKHGNETLGSIKGRNFLAS